MKNNDYLVRLRRLDVCAISDAMDKLGLQGRIVTCLEQMSSRKRIAGRVVTYRLVPANQVSQDPVKVIRHLGTAAVEISQPGDVIVVEQRTGINAGSWGGILSLGAKLKGVAGVIVDGPVRDIDEAREYDFPVYGRSLTALTARGRVVESQTNVAVTIEQVKVFPGDYVCADASGVAFISSSEIERVLDAAEMIAGREAMMAKALMEGKKMSEVMGADYEHMLN